jgi:hypothetical protein
VVLPGAHPAAPDFVAASLLLAPERRLTYLTRALVRFQQGDEAGARADAQIVAIEAPEAAASLTAHLNLGLRPYVFWPAREALAPDPELANVAAGLVRGLAEVRRTMAVYATRLARLRAAVQEVIGPDATPAWLPPHLSALLPDGPLELRQARVAVAAGAGEGDADDGPDEVEEVEIDERLETGGLGVPALLAEAQADWGALAWLCWSVGLERVALPEAIAEPPLFAVAMKTIVRRCWRAQDRVTTGGLLARRVAAAAGAVGRRGVPPGALGLPVAGEPRRDVTVPGRLARELRIPIFDEFAEGGTSGIDPSDPVLVWMITFARPGVEAYS